MKRSVLLDSSADLLLYGMGERSIVEVADALNAGIDIKDVTFVNGTVFKAKNLDSVYDYIRLPDYGKLLRTRKCTQRAFIRNTQTRMRFPGNGLWRAIPTMNMSFKILRQSRCLK